MQKIIKCPKHKVEMREDGIALKPYLIGTPDFIGCNDVVTLSYVYPGEIMGCLKCPVCGISATKGISNA